VSRKYKFNGKDKLYFVSFAVIDWIDLFIRKKYKDVVVESLKYCIEKKNPELYAWCKNSRIFRQKPNRIP
jgi:putative transposase